MRPSNLILVIDIGTSAAKVVLFDSDAKQVAITRQPYPIHTPQAGWSEQEPDVVYNGVLRALQKINPNVRDEEIVFFEQQLATLSRVLESAALRLDALRVIVAT